MKEFRLKAVATATSSLAARKRVRHPFLRGIARTIALGVRPAKVYRLMTPDEIDSIATHEDWVAVGDDLRGAISQHAAKPTGRVLVKAGRGR